MEKNRKKLVERWLLAAAVMAAVCSCSKKTDTLPETQETEASSESTAPETSAEESASESFDISEPELIESFPEAESEETTETKEPEYE